MSERLTNNAGCNHLCRTGAVLDELAQQVEPELVESVTSEVRAYTEKHPCRFVIEGNCRLNEFLIRQLLNLPKDEARLEAVETYYGELDK